MKSELLFGSEFLRIFVAYRIVTIGGRFGGGKTSLGFFLACWLYLNGYTERIHSNAPARFVDKARLPIVDAAILVDESWLYLESWTKVKEYAAFLRKANHYLILPSVWPPHARMRMLSVQRVFNGYVLGLPFWFYTWTLGLGGVREKGWFIWKNPHVIFPYYDTNFIPSDDGGIVDALSDTIAIAQSAQFKDYFNAYKETEQNPRYSEALRLFAQGHNQAALDCLIAVTKAEQKYKASPTQQNRALYLAAQKGYYDTHEARAEAEAEAQRLPTARAEVAKSETGDNEALTHLAAELDTTLGDVGHSITDAAAAIGESAKRIARIVSR